MHVGRHTTAQSAEIHSFGVPGVPGAMRPKFFFRGTGLPTVMRKNQPLVPRSNFSGEMCARTAPWFRGQTLPVPGHGGGGVPLSWAHKRYATPPGDCCTLDMEPAIWHTTSLAPGYVFMPNVEGHIWHILLHQSSHIRHYGIVARHWCMGHISSSSCFTLRAATSVVGNIRHTLQYGTNCM